mgnify:CR=1 FL=1
MKVTFKKPYGLTIRLFSLFLLVTVVMSVMVVLMVVSMMMFMMAVMSVVYLFLYPLPIIGCALIYFSQVEKKEQRGLGDQISQFDKL